MVTMRTEILRVGGSIDASGEVYTVESITVALADLKSKLPTLFYNKPDGNVVIGKVVKAELSPDGKGIMVDVKMGYP